MNNRLPLIAGNWKMHKSAAETIAMIDALKKLTTAALDVEIMVAPPFTALEAACRAIGDSSVRLGAQNVHWEEKGAFTGEIAPQMLQEFGVKYVIVGHSERRQYFGETDETVNQRLAGALNAGLIPVFCIGESETERMAGETFDVLDKQIRLGLKNIDLDAASNIVVAYEPIWAIGTGKAATSEQAQAVHAHIRSRLSRCYDEKTAAGIRVLYGGSVKPANVRGIMAQPDIDGALVGGASLDPESFAALVNFQN